MVDLSAAQKQFISDCSDFGVLEALRKFEGAVQDRHFQQAVHLAWHAHEIGLSLDIADQIIDHIDAMANLDAEVHIELSIALDLMLGTSDPCGMPSRRLHHVIQAASKSNDPFDQLAAARLLTEGVLGVEPDLEEARVWCERAAKQGSVEARDELAQLMAQVGRQSGERDGDA